MTKDVEKILRESYQEVVDEIKRLRYERLMLKNKEIHWWQGDGTDDLDSLICPIVIQPHQLKELLNSVSKDSP